MVEGSGQGWETETHRLLAVRLRNVACILSVGGLFFLVLAIVTPEERGIWELRDLIGRAAVTALLVVIAWRLCVRCTKTLRYLRVVEFLIFGSLAVQFLVNAVASQASAANLGFLINPVPPWLLLIFVYALYIPNTWQRAALVISSFVAMALTSLWIPPLLDHDTMQVLTHQPVFAGILVQESCAVAFSGLIATWGIRVIRQLQRQAFEAQQIGQYQLKRLLGQGGMGEVHLAEHVMLRRPCAIKLILPDRAGDPQSLARFEREVQSTARLTHWNTIEIYDYGRTDDGTFYYVMEYLPGLNLQQVTEINGPLPPERVIHLLSQVCDALQEAHDHGMVHRDIKPANIFAATRGGVYDVVKLLDFGLVRDRADRDVDLALTQTGTITGSPLFMSPEQATGDSFDARSDLYSLGIVGYFLLTGQVPFTSDKAIKVLMAHAQSNPPPLTQHGVAVPDDLAAIIMRCLEKSPDARFQSALELQRALNRCELARNWNREKAALWWKTNGCPDKRALDEEVAAMECCRPA